VLEALSHEDRVQKRSKGELESSPVAHLKLFDSRCPPFFHPLFLAHQASEGNMLDTSRIRQANLRKQIKPKIHDESNGGGSVADDHKLSAAAVANQLDGIGDELEHDDFELEDSLFPRCADDTAVPVPFSKWTGQWYRNLPPGYVRQKYKAFQASALAVAEATSQAAVALSAQNYEPNVIRRHRSQHYGKKRKWKRTHPTAAARPFDFEGADESQHYPCRMCDDDARTHREHARKKQRGLLNMFNPNRARRSVGWTGLGNLQVGMKVEAAYQGRDRYLEGTIFRCNGSLFHIRYNDGEIEMDVPIRRILPSTEAFEDEYDTKESEVSRAFVLPNHAINMAKSVAPPHVVGGIYFTEQKGSLWVHSQLDGQGFLEGGGGGGGCVH
jgi:hypothetical protein